MDPSASDEVGDECKESRKIHFAVQSSAPTQLDPRQVEMIRRRRPTPATLFRVADQCSPEDDQSTHQWIVGENGVLKPKRVNPNVYQPPSLKAVQKMAEAHMQNLGVYPPLEDPFEGEEYDDYPCHEEREEREERFPTKAADPQATSTTDQSEKPDEEEEGEEKEEEKEEEKTEEKTEEKAKKVRKSVKF
ncbi:protein phosphatase 1 regulatory subunit 1B [Oncorhynchus mykiss]|uniref:Protein phosphatase 1 regulatory subunit 1B n=1 Tax=Oncorhynchus mykiss TaxID=8022 RepID=A0A8C7NM80_ONCMY|nr:protein phosphatase 1 regulatory subunit 1B [Oncorhynchus mykiss]